MSVVYSAASLADLDSIEADLLAGAGLQVVQLFQNRLARAVARREQFPTLDAEYQPPDPRFPGMRHFPIRRFESYTVYYEPTDDGIRVVRILHSSRNVAAIFNPDPDPPATPPGS